jgi:hypothetical protein
MGWDSVDWIPLAYDNDNWGTIVGKVMNNSVPGNFLTQGPDAFQIDFVPLLGRIFALYTSRRIE